MSENARWYVIHTYSGYESSVAASIVKAADRRKMQELIQEVNIPTETVIDPTVKSDKADSSDKAEAPVDAELPDTGEQQPAKSKKSNKGEKTVKIFPGYVFVKMIMTDESWYVVRNIRGVTGFVGNDNKPIPLTDEEAENLGVEHREIVIGFKLGDTVKINDGPLQGYLGTVEEYDAEKDRVRVIVSMFGRETPIDLELDQVETVND